MNDTTPLDTLWKARNRAERRAWTRAAARPRRKALPASPHPLAMPRDAHGTPLR